MRDRDENGYYIIKEDNDSPDEFSDKMSAQEVLYYILLAVCGALGLIFVPNLLSGILLV